MDNKVEKFEPAFSYKLIYIFRINDRDHLGKLKIGEATIHTSKNKEYLKPNCEDLNIAAKNRINDYTSTAGINYELLHTEIAVTNNNKAFGDTNVHEVLLRSGYERFYFDTERKQNEWFTINLDTAINAIKAVKEKRKSLTSEEKNYKPDPIILRPEQDAAIRKTIAQFKKGNNMLWNAKMRFGKTICALEIVKREKYNKTIILTHRPVVDKGWYEDFEKIFNSTDYLYGSKNKGEKLEKLVSSNNPFVYFASIQDLRGSKEVGGKFEKNELVFNTNWDFVVVDEAHEGTKTEKGVTTLEEVIKLDNDYPTKILKLSGTAFNLLEDYDEDEIYTWDYIMEQEVKHNWYIKHYGDPNPYEDLPELQIYTYDLNKLLPGYEAVYDTAFNFREFFRVWTNDVQKDGIEMPTNAKIGQFVHESDVKKFLDLICRSDEYSNYPYSKESYREYFRHSLWMVPGVKEAKALSKMLNEHSVFGSGQFEIINIAGDGDEEKPYKDAYDAVIKGIGDKPEETYSITISCGKMTTGVTIKPWTAVFMLSGSYSTAASSYLQTIFRVQSPANIGGKIKEKCYVFDFAPDRSLKMIASATRLSIKAGDTSSRTLLGKFLNFCPVISIDGSKMTPYNVDLMMGQLKKAYAERVVSNGFDDRYIYNDNLFKLDENALQKFKELEEIVGASKPTKKIEKIDINNQGFTDEQYEELQKIEKKPKKELTEEEKRLLEEYKEKRKQADTAISILRAISIRIPLLIYGANIKDNEDITVDNLTDIVDDESWLEFMPKGVTKEKFKDFSQYYEQDIFVEAGRKIRRAAKYADTLSPTERVKEIANIFGSFRNPDKETVLTPWKTVNMHLGDTIGGYNFFDKKNENGEYTIVSIEEPRYITYGEVTQNILNNTNAKILEINSKSGLYPLYMTYSLYRQKCLDTDSKKLTDELEQAIWNEVIQDNIFVLCKTPMAKMITERTLMGYRKINNNIKYDSKMFENIKENVDNYAKRINEPNYWKKEGEKMNFQAVVGNPPYQLGDGSGGADDSAVPVYDIFVKMVKKIYPSYFTLIMPSKWMLGGRGLQKFREEMINDHHISLLYDYEDAKECFDNVHIDGGICYFLWDKNYDGETNHIFKNNIGKISKTKHFLKNDYSDYVIRDGKISDLIRNSFNGSSFSTIVSSSRPFGIRNYLFNSPERYSELNLSYEEYPGSIKIYGVKGIKGGARRQVGYVERNKISKGKEIIDKYKLFFTTSYSTNAIIPPEIIIGKPGEICTETFLVIGPFDTENECLNCLNFMKTNFFRTLLYFGKGTMHVTQSVFKYIPLLNFNESWNDDKIIKKFNLTEENIKLISDTIEKK